MLRHFFHVTSAKHGCAFKSRMALEITVEITVARDSHIFPMADFTSISKSFLLTEDELTILAAEAFAECWEAVKKALQVLVHAGCASLQFTHFAFPLSLF